MLRCRLRVHNSGSAQRNTVIVHASATTSRTRVDPVRTSTPDAKRVVVIGGGVGGLTVGGRLAKEGFNVTLLEANTKVCGLNLHCWTTISDSTIMSYYP